MDYRDHVFLTVAENLSFSKAAEALFVSQPAVTKHIKELESKLNISLFQRKGNKIYLTEAGRLTYDHLKKIRLSYKALEYDIERLNNAFKGSLRIGASSTISQYLLPKVLAAFYKRYPQIELFLFNGNSFEMEQKLLDNEIDMALVENESSQSNIKYLDFQDDEIIVVTGQNSVFGKRKTINLNDISEIPIVLREQGSGTLQVIQKALAKHQVLLSNLKIVMHLGSTESIKNFLGDFEGIALVSEKSVERELQAKELVKLKIKDVTLNRKFRLALQQGEQVSATKLLIDFILHYNY